MFCEKCDNFMDITSNISTEGPSNEINNNINKTLNDNENNNNNDSDEDSTLGDLYIESDEEKEKETENEIDKINITTSISKKTKNINDSSDYNNSITVSNSETLSDEDVTNILMGKNTTVNITEKIYNNINKNTFFNSLNSNEKTLILNRLYEKLPKNSKIFKSHVTGKHAYYYCNNCGFNKQIENGTFIFGRNKNSNNKTFDRNIITNKFDTTLPFTRDYNCINDKCTTHKNPEIKKAVFYRINNSHNIRYICSVCDSYWNNN